VCICVALAGQGLPQKFCIWHDAGTNYGNGANGGVHIGSNSYITFGGGATDYASLGPSIPARPSIHISSRDNSWKQLWAGPASNGCFRWVLHPPVIR
jgi:hypothetical protein